MKRKNVRSLDEIADAIHRLERTNIIDIGDLLLEAKLQCGPGHWLQWLYNSEFEWSEDTAERYMRVAELSSRFRALRNLELATTTLYELANYEPEENLPAIIKELAKHATKARLAPRDARRVIKIGIGRCHFGDHPDATLAALVDLDERSDERWYEKAVAALLEREPTTDEDATTIIDEVPDDDDQDNEFKDDTDEEIEAILDGPPPELPPPSTPPEPQKLKPETEWAETEQFAHAVTDLLEMCVKPIARFMGQFEEAELREVADFLMAIAAADKSKAA